MAFTYGTYTWDTMGSADESAWLFNGTQGSHTPMTASNSNGGNFCWNDTSTPSSSTGPTTGQGGNPDGYLYCETSSPCALNDIFTMELNSNLDASANAITIELYTDQTGSGNNMTLDVQTNENAAGWVTRASYGGSGDPAKDAGWTYRSIDLTGVVSHSITRIRFLFTMPSSGTTYQNDYAIDTVTITGVTTLTQTHQMML